MYTPGWPFLLMLGLIFRAPWIVNPLLASLAIFLFYFLGKEIYNRQIGLLTSFLGAASIWFLLMSSTMMSHTSSLFFACFFLLYLFRSLKNPSLANGVLTGIGLGIAFLIRPYNAVLFSTPFLVYYAFHFFKEMKLRLKNAMAFALTTIAFISVLLIYNQLTNGNPFKMGYIATYGKEVLPGLGNSPFTDVALTMLRARENIIDYLKAINSDLFGWPITSFYALLPLLLLSKIKPVNRKKDLLLACGFFSMLIGLYFYWGTFPIIGARLIFESVSLLVLLSARGISELPSLLRLIFKSLSPTKVNKIIAMFLIAFIVYGFTIRFPRWVWPKDTEYQFETYDHNFAGTTAFIHNAARSLGIRKAVVLMKFLYHPTEEFPTGWWGSGFVYNDPDLQGSIIYANNQGNRNIALFDCLPERNFYLYLGTLEKGMLIPLKKEGEKISYGEPLTSSLPKKNCIKLVASPQGLFKAYSPEFKEFLDNLYKENKPFEVDVDRLMELGNLFKKNRNFKDAAFCFEAALQVENTPRARRFLLNELIGCYFKAGKNNEAKRVGEKIKKADFQDEKLYRLFPEKGF